MFCLLKNGELDKSAANKILNYINKIKHQKIIIIISHDIELIEFCDEILNLSNIESGLKV